ncbi:alpha/beta hydrolase [uncultured Leifsonia sp.]|uniref:alpha/beta fold hydrolase n=1 Tax=uncultured Leifsonia sp. TaxID=340359 RepID=UPI0028D22F4E|nr:alpha/beta hydrolase [uncultured Leifsonia sp.]
MGVVLVHGAYADGSIWRDVIRELLGAGVRTTAVQNPLTSLVDDADAARRAIEAQPGKVVLVGHSWAGTVISEIGDHDKVAGLVFVSARAPEAGEDFADIAAQFPAPPISSGVTEQDGFRRLQEDAFYRDLANGVMQAEAQLLYAVQAPISRDLFSERTSRAAWKVRPTWYLISTEDRATAPSLQRFLAKRMGARTVEVASGHLPMMTNPVEVANVILEAVTAVAVASGDCI